MTKNNSNSFMRLEQRDFEVFYQQQDADIINEFANHIKSTISTITEFFNVELSQKIEITIIPDRECYKNMLGIIDYQEWMVGRSENNYIYLLSPQNAMPTHSFNEMLQVLIHELVHHVQDVKLGNTDISPFWLAEGIACYLANQFDTQEEYQKALLEKAFPKISDISNDDAPDFGGYTYAPVYVKYFLQTFGKEAFLKCLENNSLLQSFINENFEKDAIASFEKTEIHRMAL